MGNGVSTVAVFQGGRLWGVQVVGALLEGWIGWGRPPGRQAGKGAPWVVRRGGRVETLGAHVEDGTR